MVSPSLNAATLRANHSIAAASRAINTSLKRLATGKRINRASDDPAGMIAAGNLKVNERTIQKQIESLMQEDAFHGAREGAQSVLSDLLVELTGLVVTASSRDSLAPAERESLQLQADSLIQTINKLSNEATFKDQRLLDGFQASRLGAQPVLDGGPQLSLASLQRGGKLNLINGDLETAQKVVESSATTISEARAAAGARSKAIASTISSLQSELENTSAARSQIEDADFAAETAALVRNQVLQDAATFTATLLHEQMRTLTEQLLDAARDDAPRKDGV